MICKVVVSEKLTRIHFYKVIFCQHGLTSLYTPLQGLYCKIVYSYLNYYFNSFRVKIHPFVQKYSNHYKTLYVLHILHNPTDLLIELQFLILYQYHRCNVYAQTSNS